jgi:hypothetical protein
MSESQPPPTVLESGGPLLSTAQFMLLLSGASSEGLALDVEAAPHEVRAEAWFQREWQDLLASIALFGPARVVLPAHIAAEVNIEPLLEREVAEIVIVDATAELRQQVASTYEQAFTRCRELEGHPASTPLISLDAPVPGHDERLEGHMLAGDANYYIERLLDQVLPLIEGLHDIFGYYVDKNQVEALDVLSGYNERIFPNGWPSEVKDPSIRTSDLLKSMGLYVRDRGPIEAQGLNVSGIAYMPECLINFEDWDKTLTSAPDDLQAFMSLGLTMSVFDRAAFLAVHAFWRSFYELVNMLRVSKLTANPLYMPSTARIRQLPKGHAARRETSESLRMYRLFLTETGRLPSPDSINDLDRLRSDPGLSSLRSVLAQWAEVSRGATDSDASVLNKIRGDIVSATSRLKRSEKLGRMGSVVSLLSLPVTVYDALKGSALGLGLAPLGPMIEGVNAREIRKASWVRFGSP